MFSMIFGFLLAGFITVYSCLNTAENHEIFINSLGILVVIGGTFAATIITFNFRQLIKLTKNIARIFYRRTYIATDVVNELLRISNNISQNRGAIKTEINNCSHPFIADGLNLIYNDFSEAQIKKMMSISLNERKISHLSQVDILKSISKYPPAFGMIGTVIGLVALLESISLETGVEKIGPNMAVALITTLYGLLFSNFIIIPLSENLFNKTREDIHIRKIIIDGIVLLKSNLDTITIQETLNSYLHPKMRDEFEIENSFEPEGLKAS